MLFFGHDSTFMPILESLKTKPPIKSVSVASQFEIALYENRRHQYFIHIELNGKLLDTAVCPKGVCTLKQFSLLG